MPPSRSGTRSPPDQRRPTAARRRRQPANCGCAVKVTFCVRGVISPLLANVALDGMERLFGAEDAQGRYVRPSGRRGLDHGVSLIRYADDLVVTAPTREALATYVIPKLNAFLGERGLKL